MGFPSENFERFFRNPMPEVQRFLQLKHEGTYKVYNLCAERHYDKERFFGRVEENYAFYDHEAPRWQVIIPFCQSVHQWLTQDVKNIGVIHCKAGKGRTGVMISCYMLFSKMKPTAADALQFYANARTMNKKGVTIPSQQRYVKYLDRVLQLNKDVNWDGNFQVPHPENSKLRVKKVILHAAPLFKPTRLSFSVCTSNFQVIYEYDKDKKDGVMFHHSDDKIEFECDIIVNEDFKIVLTKKSGGKFKKYSQFWVNTHFIDDNTLTLPKSELDKVYKDKKHKKYPENFAVTVQFESVTETKEPSISPCTLQDSATPVQ